MATPRKPYSIATTALAAVLALSAGAAHAQWPQPSYPIVQSEGSTAPTPAQENPVPTADAPPVRVESPAYSAGATAADIAMQPAKDIGVKKTQIPPVLTAAEASPYAMKDTANCAAMAQALADLDEALGPDYTVERTENKAGKIAEAGGRAVINSIIPFRGIVREVTGAAAADRALASATDAGIARRGFLRGLQTAQGCEGATTQARLER